VIPSAEAKRAMTCQRCGQSEDPPGVKPAAQVDILSIRLNGCLEVFQARLCRACRAALTTAIARAVEPVGRAAA
jgi:hypothetical protein